MTHSAAVFVTLTVFVGCSQSPAVVTRASTPAAVVVTKPTRPANQTLIEARREFKTNLIPRNGQREPVAIPPRGIFRVVKYPSPVGDLAAYLSPDPETGRKHPAIIWITGGDCNSIGNVWDDQPEANDQSARPYRRENIMLMFPSLRGGNQNPGKKEGFLGEVDDVLAAREFLAKQAYVDPERIYLGGHSTGGTLVLLVAACSDQFRAVISFGPVSEMWKYPPELLPFDVNNEDESRIRSPVHWVHCIKSPTFIFEGASGNVDSMGSFIGHANKKIQGFVIQKGDHFNLLAPINQVMAKKMLEDKGPTCNINVTSKELNNAMR